MSRELLCLDDVDPYARECLDPLEEFTQDVYHQLFEEPDENLDATLNGVERGLGLLGMLSGPIIPNLSNLIENYWEKDPRITLCTASVTTVPNGNGPAVTTISMVFDINTDTLNAEGYAVTIVKTNNSIQLVRP